VPDHPADGPLGDDPAARLAARLPEAFRALGQVALPDDERGRWHERLIAITNAAKHDVGRAEARLDRWFAELAAAADGGRTA
jgi:hypothetical protein